MLSTKVSKFKAVTVKGTPQHLASVELHKNPVLHTIHKMSQHHVPYTMALIMAAGGTYGFVRTGSKISLGAGLGLGALYALAG